ncbi:MAG TPA: DUF2203 domain-containing protein [Candidatus Limnocylindria bacterium]|nr:DUF2203 domain-containing protein [Candidatus Limnocylindria bacterium]
MPRFTRAEAERLLPTVRPMLEDLRRRMAAFRRQQSEPLAREIRAIAQEIAELGVELKDPDQGLIDFRAVRRGREVYLCWKLGEPERILYWHDLDAGFAGRQAIDA